MHHVDDLAALVAHHAPADGTFDTSLPGVRLIRSSSPTVPMPVIYEPTVCFVAQGRKRATLGATAYDYDPANHLIASVGLPVMGRVTEASEEAPYLCVQIDLDIGALSELAQRHPSAPDAPEPLSTGLTLTPTEPALIDAVTRLVSFADTPRDADALGPLAMREILYRLLTGPGGHVVRHMASADSRLSQIARAILWLRARYTQSFRIEDAADVAGMSRSSFHLHFKAVTGMSPIEFRTQLRMQEARRLMLAGAMDAATAGFNVGYESPSHFSRDYSRLFGSPPASDAQRLRATG